MKQLFRYGLGRHEKSDDQPVIDARPKFRDSGFRLRECHRIFSRSCLKGSG